MGQCYLLGGDAWHDVTWTKRLCQSFRPQSDFTLQFVDIIEKHYFWHDPPSIDLHFADGYGHPAGDRISRGKFMELPYSFSSPLWIFAESWGKTLTENHPWWPGPPEQHPEVTLKNGIVTLVNPGYTASKIDTISGYTYPPLVSDYGNHLYVHHHSPVATGHPQTHWISYCFITQKPLIETWYLEAVISHGTLWPPLVDCGATPLGSCFWEGKGPHIFDLTEWWKFCRAFHGLDNDPTGWKLSAIQLRVEDTEATPGTTLSNSYLSIARRKFEPPPYDDYPIQVYPALEDEIKHRAHYYMAPYPLHKDSTYALVIRRPSTWPPIASDIMYDKGNATYLRGHKSHSDDRGETWIDDDDDDVCFAVYGTPPTPSSPPVAPAGNIAFLDIKQTITATGYKIVLTTDVPCHLYMMWTNKEPNKHKIVGLRRGDLALRETRYCFTAWHKNEQEEAGDTLYHTFIKEPWPVCETRWFTFRGEIQSLWSASASPIFKKHRPSPPVTRYFYSDPHPEETSVDGRAYHNIWAGLPWPELIAAPGTGADDWTDNLTLDFYGSTTRDKFYLLSRLLLLFDTSDIEIGRTILDAKLRIFIGFAKGWNYYPEAKVALVPSNPASNIEIEPADYQRLGSTLLSNDLAPLIVEYYYGDWFTFNLNAAGLAAITKGGITKLGLREHYYDILGNIPDYHGFTWWGWHIWSAEHITPERRPRLEVSYK